MFSNLLADFVDSNFLTRETAELSRVNAQLKGAVNLNRATLSEQAQQLAAGESQLAGLGTQRQSLIAEIQKVADRQSQSLREATAAQNKATTAADALSKVEGQLANARAELTALRDGYSREKTEWKAIAIAEVDRATTTARATAAETIGQLEAEIQTHAAEAARLATEAADRSAELQQVNAELNRLTTALSQAEIRFTERTADLIAAYQVSTDEHAAKLQTLASDTSERVLAFELEIKSRENRISELEAQFAELKAQIIEEAQQRIDIARGQFENEQVSALNQLEADRLTVHKELTMNQEALIEKYRPMIEAPLLEELRQTQIEVGRVHKKLAEKAGDDLTWNPDQIREFLLDIDADGDSPSHVRVCGATKSGKSFFVNQIISVGLKSLGFDADFTVIDPYHSQTKWVIPPTVSNDSEAAVALIMQWAAACDGKPLDRPGVLVVDELDSLLADYKDKAPDKEKDLLAAAIKTIVKKGRHYNRFFYWLGQNGNTSAGLQWSDIKNLNQIYLGGVADDYCENGLKGRNKNRWLGELEALRDKSKYHALVHCKGANPYTRLLPKSYFETEATAVEITAAPTKMVCPKCQSTKTKKSGILNGRQRLYCHDCKADSYAE